MGREDIHRCLIFVILTLACLIALTAVKAEEVKHTTFNETESTELLLSNDISSNVEIPSEFMNENPHLMENKPTKMDLDVSDMIYTDSKTDAEVETQVDSTIDRKSSCKNLMTMDCLEKNLSTFIDNASKEKSINITDFVQILKNQNVTSGPNNESLIDKVHRFAKSHVMRININQDLLNPRESRTFFGAVPPAVVNGQNPFLTGFGLGFIAFGLKKLLLPLMIGVQIIKTMLVALFLPSIIGSIGKIVGKGVSSFAQSSQGAPAQPEENFEFKDNSDLYSEDYMSRQPLGTLPASAMYDEGMLMQPSPKPDSRLTYVDSRLSNAAFNDRYYTRHVVNQGLSKKQDFKVFHEIPTSSLLLTNYDPFYSPLLSRLDAVFSRLGHTTEGCREYAVCAMYRSPARFAPYSNLVSAQLSRELNELRRPSSDNPDVLRFFRYMKAAKDGQDGVKCKFAYPMCDVPRDDPSQIQNLAMVATYEDIDKLVHARKL